MQVFVKHAGTIMPSESLILFDDVLFCFEIAGSAN